MPSAHRTATTRQARPQTSSDWRPRRRLRAPRRVPAEGCDPERGWAGRPSRLRRLPNHLVRRPRLERRAGAAGRLPGRRVAVTTVATRVTAATLVTATTGTKIGESGPAPPQPAILVSNTSRRCKKDQNQWSTSPPSAHVDWFPFADRSLNCRLPATDDHLSNRYQLPGAHSTRDPGNPGRNADPPARRAPVTNPPRARSPAQTSITTGTIMGRRLVRSDTNRPRAERARRFRVSKSTQPVSEASSRPSSTA